MLPVGDQVKEMRVMTTMLPEIEEVSSPKKVLYALLREPTQIAHSLLGVLSLPAGYFFLFIFSFRTWAVMCSPLHFSIASIFPFLSASAFIFC